MRFVTIQDFRKRKRPRDNGTDSDENVVLMSAGRPVALVIPVTGDTLEEEIEAVRQARATLALARIHRATKAAGLQRMSMKHVDAVIADVRKKRRPRLRATR